MKGELSTGFRRLGTYLLHFNRSVFVFVYVCVSLSVFRVLSPTWYSLFHLIHPYLYERVIKGVCCNLTPLVSHGTASPLLLQCRANPSSMASGRGLPAFPLPHAVPSVSCSAWALAWGSAVAPGLVRPPTWRMCIRLGPPCAPPTACCSVWKKKRRSSFISSDPSQDHAWYLKSEEKKRSG